MEDAEQLPAAGFDFLKGAQLFGGIHAETARTLRRVGHRDYAFHNAAFASQQAAALEWQALLNVGKHLIPVFGAQFQLIDHGQRMLDSCRAVHLVVQPLAATLEWPQRPTNRPGSCPVLPWRFAMGMPLKSACQGCQRVKWRQHSQPKLKGRERPIVHSGCNL